MNQHAKEEKSQEEAAALMGQMLDAADDCADQSAKDSKIQKQQEQTAALMDAEVQAATDCGC